MVLTREEVGTVLRRLQGVHWLMATLLYGAGLRLMECCRLRIKDIDFSQNQVVVRGGKGDKDRYTILPAAVQEPLLRHLQGVKRQQETDLQKGLGRVALLNALDRKYPHAGKEWAWQWVLPVSSHYPDRITGEKRRHPLHAAIPGHPARDNPCESVLSSGDQTANRLTGSSRTRSAAPSLW